MTFQEPIWQWLRARDDNETPAEELLNLLKDPFSGTLASASVYSALGTSLGFTAIVALLFSFLRPYNQAVYAPKLKHADEKHAPPPLGKKPWSWVLPLMSTHEEKLMQQIGMDATIFLRVMRMCRNIFVILAVVGVSVLIPVHYKMSTPDSNTVQDSTSWILQITPLNVWGRPLWVQVVIAWVFDIVVCFFLWWNYRRITQLRRKYFESEDYQNSLHSRTLMLYDIPKQGCSDEGIARIIDGVAPNSSFARTAIARNVKDLPDLIAAHDRAVRKLEKVLAIYLKNPNNLPPRPTCKPSKKDRSYGTYPKGQRLDAIEYYTQRIRELEVEVKEVRASVDKRSSMPFGFASYSEVAEAHEIAYITRRKKPHGTTIKLAPKPIDIIWPNMPLSSSTRSRRRWFNSLWIILLTFFWIAPNAMIAIFLVNLSNLGKVWKGFQNSLESDTKFWGIVQGIASPAITSGVYLALPVIFRRLSIRAGDKTKTGRERHVMAKLYSFFVFNNLIVFSFFSVIWSFVVSVINDADKGENAWDAIIKEDLAASIFIAFCRNSPFWITYLLQRQLGAAIDLAQMWPLINAFFTKTFSSPTPRELIELTAPPAFDYASYYCYFLYYSTVTLCFAGIQPLVLIATALYFTIDSFLKKYLILYRFVTKTESGGLFWRVIFNRFIFGTILSNGVFLLTCWVRGDGTHLQFFCVCPLPVLLIFFKIYCGNAYDDRMRYYKTRGAIRQDGQNAAQKENNLRNEKLASRFGHPALYKPLITPMVHQKAQNLLPSVYSGRLTDGRDVGPAGDLMSVSGYSDMYALNSMQGGKPGKAADGVPGFEYVSESQMDFEYYKNRAEFTEEHGGGEIYGKELDGYRPGTPGSLDSGSRPGTPSNRHATPFSPANVRLPPPHETAYRPSPYGEDSINRHRSPLYSQENSSSSGLVHNAVGPAMAPPMSYRNVSHERSQSPALEKPFGGYQEVPLDRARSPAVGSPAQTPGVGIGGPRGYAGVPQYEDAETPEADPMQYNYFRGGSKSSKPPGQGW
ncbi:uncharacterized protein TrAtP1_000104 [Trichoderma atroviride]|uniref:DUF221-domain-containing protein n=1 Tax=Hypocrea atroviridis (strain ATCC 20476 / IMI 206040) TaxID=452589 RepID=G9NK49_HYPAI|nr:uncharacterized protein TRIATDRAFT_49430 [Trichoderma atroviride IMI 206040]EHK49269.1 hypothetical protein TRIATDRAFT_49430 [Trichoderma atroviride IMI 206040]UKZ58780.1 hypothetical protein TrAtP1_000104 [Trichoderma atroviride]